jgi:hypothetical protein
LYALPNIIRKIESKKVRWAGHVVRIWKKMNAYRILVERPEGKGPLGRPRCRWANNIELDLREIGWSDVDWFNLALDINQWSIAMKTPMNLRFP